MNVEDYKRPCDEDLNVADRYSWGKPINEGLNCIIHPHVECRKCLLPGPCIDAARRQISSRYKVIVVHPLVRNL